MGSIAIGKCYNEETNSQADLSDQSSGEICRRIIGNEQKGVGSATCQVIYR
jgi:hypothetical protein